MRIRSRNDNPEDSSLVRYERTVERTKANTDNMSFTKIRRKPSSMKRIRLGQKHDVKPNQMLFMFKPMPSVVGLST